MDFWSDFTTVEKASGTGLSRDPDLMEIVIYADGRCIMSRAAYTSIGQPKTVKLKVKGSLLGVLPGDGGGCEFRVSSDFSRRMGRAYFTCKKATSDIGARQDGKYAIYPVTLVSGGLLLDAAKPTEVREKYKRAK